MSTNDFILYQDFDVTTQTKPITVRFAPEGNSKAETRDVLFLGRVAQAYGAKKLMDNVLSVPKGNVYPANRFSGVGSLPELTLLTRGKLFPDMSGSLLCAYVSAAAEGVCPFEALEGYDASFSPNWIGIGPTSPMYTAEATFHPENRRLWTHARTTGRLVSPSHYPVPRGVGEVCPGVWFTLSVRDYHGDDVISHLSPERMLSLSVCSRAVHDRYRAICVFHGGKVILTHVGTHWLYLTAAEWSQFNFGAVGHLSSRGEPYCESPLWFGPTRPSNLAVAHRYRFSTHADWRTVFEAVAGCTAVVANELVRERSNAYPNHGIVATSLATNEPIPVVYGSYGISFVMPAGDVHLSVGPFSISVLCVKPRISSVLHALCYSDTSLGQALSRLPLEVLAHSLPAAVGERHSPHEVNMLLNPSEPLIERGFNANYPLMVRAYITERGWSILEDYAIFFAPWLHGVSVCGPLARVAPTAAMAVNAIVIILNPREAVLATPSQLTKKYSTGEAHLDIFLRARFESGEITNYGFGLTNRVVEYRMPFGGLKDVPDVMGPLTPTDPTTKWFPVDPVPVRVYKGHFHRLMCGPFPDTGDFENTTEAANYAAWDDGDSENEEDNAEAEDEEFDDAGEPEFHVAEDGSID